jgi:hypothetical protein
LSDSFGAKLSITYRAAVAKVKQPVVIVGSQAVLEAPEVDVLACVPGGNGQGTAGLSVRNRFEK